VEDREKRRGSETDDVEAHKQRGAGKLAANEEAPKEGETDDDVELHAKKNPSKL
jgi:hypothetical protein